MGVVGHRRPLGVHDVVAAAEAVALCAASGAHDNPINRGTADKLGLPIPPGFLTYADDVIE